MIKDTKSHIRIFIFTNKSPIHYAQATEFTTCVVYNIFSTYHMFCEHSHAIKLPDEKMNCTFPEISPGLESLGHD